MKFLVLGCGSIGTRHIVNLQSLGHKVYCYDKDRAKMDKVVAEQGVEVLDFDAKHLQIDGWIICTPPELHVGFAMKALERNCHAFIEKPISSTFSTPEGTVDEMLDLADKKGLTVMTGYQMRFSPGLMKLKDMIDKQSFGPLYYIYAEYGKALPEWHPWEDYRLGYTAYTGIALDASHEIQYVCMLAGSKVVKIKSIVNKANPFQVQAESMIDMLLKFENDITANIHLDMIQREWARRCKVIMERKEIDWRWLSEKEDCYIKEMEHFIKCIEGREKEDSQYARDVLEIVLTAKGIMPAEFKRLNLKEN